MTYNMKEKFQLDFLEACSIGAQHKVVEYLESGRVDINFQHNINKWTALHWAARRGNLPICQVLIAAGFRKDVRDSTDKTPYEVCKPGTDENLLKLLIHDDVHNEIPQTSGDTNTFMPSYLKHPVFPYAPRSTGPTVVEKSRDTPPSPTTPTTPTTPTNGAYYSYGRRDSAQKTRFLLLRTCRQQGKEAFKRITLPGGSTVEQLKSTIEKAMQRPVDAVLTLPDNILIEEDDQILEFGNSQRIDVIYAEEDSDSLPTILPTNNGKSAKKPAMDQSVTSEEYSIIPNGTAQEDDVAAEIDHNETSTLATGDAPVEEEKDDDSVSESVNINSPAEPMAQPEPALPQAQVLSNSPVVRESQDSEPGDYVKVQSDDTKADEELSNEAVEEPTPEEPVSVPEIIKEQPKKAKSWLDDNQDTVRRAATVAAVASVAGIGYLVYARKFK